MSHASGTARVSKSRFFIHFLFFLFACRVSHAPGAARASKSRFRIHSFFVFWREECLTQVARLEFRSPGFLFIHFLFFVCLRVECLTRLVRQELRSPGFLFFFFSCIVSRASDAAKYSKSNLFFEKFLFFLEHMQTRTRARTHTLHTNTLTHVVILELLSLYVSSMCPYMCPYVCPYMCPHMCPSMYPYMRPYMYP